MKQIAMFIGLLLIGLLMSSTIFSQQANDNIARATAMIEALNKADYNAAGKNFDNTMQQAFSAEKMAQVWQAINAQAGAFKRIASTRVEKVGAIETVYVTCEFDKVSLDAKVVFNAEHMIAGFFIVPTQPAAYQAPAYVHKDAFQEREVKVGEGEFALPGTLTIPQGKGPFPAVVLVHGSGPNDRDETIGPNHPFRDLAWGLASKNIAVLRYEKRTRQFPQQFMSGKNGLTVNDETVNDALAAAELLRATKEIDGKRVFILGHSLGGMMVPRMGKLAQNVAGFIILAGLTRPLEDTIIEQLDYISALNAKPSEQEEAQLKKIKEEIGKVKTLANNSTDTVMGIPASYWLDLRSYHPAEVVKEVKVPLLILQGERDYQVTMVDFHAWQGALAERKDVVFKSYPKLNHLFFEGEGKCSPAEYQQVAHVMGYVIDDIANWINK